MRKLWQVKTIAFTAGLLSDESDVVVNAAPVLGWFIGKKVQDVQVWLRRTNNGTLTQLGTKPDYYEYYT